MSLSIDANVLRLLDANANRAREGLRVLEDYCRFMLDDQNLSSKLKHIRHDLTSATVAFLPDAILYRDTPGDVGTSIKTDAELNRHSTGEVVIAAGKRFGEALRALEEFCKTFSASTAGQLEKIRYGFYDIERSIALTLGKGRQFQIVKLYVLITESACRHPWLETAEQAIAGGADAIQLREKNLESGELLDRAKRLAAVCKRHRVLLIINDRPDIALLSNADGVHLGQGDIPAVEARKIIGNEKIVGVSTHEIRQARQAVLDGADYIGVGPVFRSRTKVRDWDQIPGLQYCSEVAATIQLPAMAIAGINQGNLASVIKTGMKAIAVTAAVTDCEDPCAAATWFKERMNETDAMRTIET